MPVALHPAGATIVVATDASPGFALHRELELYVQAGLPAPEVLRIATPGATTVMHREKELRSIAPGKLADLIVVDGDPSTRIGDIRRVQAIVKDGIVFHPADLYRALGVRPDPAVAAATPPSIRRREQVAEGSPTDRAVTAPPARSSGRRRSRPSVATAHPWGR